ncbi:SusC/RagA family TonB-linked outer membrane protein [Spongiivirga citrea]|uniref:SusC/RagA family TonB-linked outer membrane protein n=2 Tax=Spongiivirga citrea TaxID=1481457 RepID=A0A6M0CN95_9FLAO|nr:SusC/RagA family TonB-linked outer membrane protein [Spongiivirga citrea]
MKTMQKYLLLVLFLIPIGMFAQNQVKGTVTEKATGTPLPGASVVVKGTTNGTQTDFDGNYIINANTGDILVFSYVGFKTIELSVNTNVINVSLEDDLNKLDEVVVIGYGSTTVRDATGSVTAVTSEDFNQGNMVTAENLLNGRTAGVTVNTSGAPGSGSTIRIRGGASLSANNSPLIVIDGLPITNDTAGGSRSILASINPNDIESFSILKDASASAIYGSRASNGVIIITTKKGKSSLRVNYDVTTGYNTVADRIDVFSADEFRNQINQRQPLIANELGSANTDWQDEIFETQFSVNHSISASGSLFGAIPARLSVGYNRQPGTLKTSNFERATYSLALNPSLFDEHLRINLNANYSREDNRFAGAGNIGAALRFDPTQPVLDPSNPFGGFFQYIDGNGNRRANAPTNPVANLLQVRNFGNVDRFYGRAEFDYKLHFFPDMRAVVQLGYDKSNGEGTNITDPISINGFNANTGIGDPQQNNNSAFESIRENTQLNAYLVYNKEVGNLGLEITGGYDYQKFVRSDFGTNNLNAFNPTEPDNAEAIDVVLASFFGRANFDIANKYLLTLTYRRDGSSRFTDDFRWGNFPAAAFAWKINEEGFLKDSQTVSNLKLRLGWGITGQQDINAGSLVNAFQSTLGLSSNVAQYVFGVTPIVTALPNYRNPLLKWEETTQYNAGIDFGLFDQRLSGSIDVFRKESKDLLVNSPVADGANFSNSGAQNIGKLSSEGIELTVEGDVVRNDNFNWNLSFNTTFLNREIDQLPLGADINVGGRAGGTGGTIQVWREGENPSSFFVYKQLYDTAGEPIEGAFQDLDGNGIINASDRYIKGNADAFATMGLRSTNTYKNFDFSFTLRASLGNEVYNNVSSANAYYSLLNGNGFPSNVPTTVTTTNFINQNSQIINSDIYVEDGSFLKMDNINLGYTFNELANTEASLRVWTGVQNVFIISDYSGLDPEIPSGNGIDGAIYPRPRTFLLGANLSF